MVFRLVNIPIIGLSAAFVPLCGQSTMPLSLDLTLTASTSEISGLPIGFQKTLQPLDGTITVNNPKDILDASTFPGADLGAKVKAAAMQLDGSCGEINIPFGIYTWSTTALLSHCQTLTGNAVIKVTAMTTPALVIASPINTGNPQLHKHGSMSHLTFIGPAPADTSGASWTIAQKTQVGIYLGSDPAGIITPSNYVSYLMDFTDLYVTGFGCGFNIANGSQFAFFGGTEYLNYNNYCFTNTAGVENISLTGNQNLAAVQYGIYQSTSAAFVQLNIDSTSLDYNGQNFSGGQGIHMGNVALSVAKSYFEGPLQSTQIEAGYNGDIISVNSTRFNFVNTAGYAMLPSIFVVDGSNVTLDLNDITALTASASPVGTISELVKWQATGSYNQLYSGTYFYGSPFTKLPLPLTQTAPNIQFYRVPSVDAIGNTNGLNVNNITLGVPYTASTPTIRAFTDGSGPSVPYDSQLAFTPDGVYVEGKDLAHSSLNAGILSSNFFYPEAESKSPTGHCSRPAIVSMTADGVGKYCSVLTGLWTLFYGSDMAVAPLAISVTTTASTSDSFTLAGMTPKGHCFITPTNAAAISATQAGITAKGRNSISLTHAVTAGMTYDVLCTTY